MIEPTKQCCTCGIEQPLSCYNRRRAAHDGLQSRCRSCSQQWYRANSEAHRVNVRRNSAAMIARNKALLAAYLLEHPCVDCGERDVRCLELDHRVDSGKLTEVGRLLGNAVSWSRILAEIDKCDVRCANCHRRVTVERGGYWRQAVHERVREELSSQTTARLHRVLPARAEA